MPFSGKTVHVRDMWIMQVWTGVQLYRDVERLDLLLARRSHMLEEVRQSLLSGPVEHWMKYLDETRKIRREFDEKRRAAEEQGQI